MNLLGLRLFVVTIAALILCTQSAFAQSLPMRIVILGDSLTSGTQLAANEAFPTMIERKLLSEGYNVKVTSMGGAGETVMSALTKVGEVVKQNPDIVIIQLGINDAMRGLDIDGVIFPNLNKIIAEFKARKIGVLLCGIKQVPGATKAYSQKLHSMYYTSAKHYRTSLYYDILKGVTGRDDLSLADGLHPNEKGTLAMVQNIYPTLKPLVDWRVKFNEYKSSVQ